MAFEIISLICPSATVLALQVIFYAPFFNAKDISITMTMKEFYEYSNIELHLFSLEINSFDIVDVNYKTFPDIPVIQGVLMSCAIPIIFCPVCIEKKCFIDGGFKTNYPLEHCIELNPEKDEILGIKNNFSGEEDEDNIIKDDSTILEYIIHISNKFMNSIKTTTNIKIENEIISETKHVSFSLIKEAFFSADIRKNLLDEGIQVAKDYISSKNIH
jgi:predicted acylesterase/phospholipase RssA